MPAFLDQLPWLRIRLATYAIALCTAAIAPMIMADDAFRQGATSFATGLSGMLHIAIPFYVVFCLVVCAMFILLFGLDAAASSKSERWSLPTHRSNPFTWKHIHFWHFAGHLMLAAGLGTLIAAIWTGPFWIIFGCMILGLAAAALLAVRVGTRIYRGKFIAAQST